MEMKYKIEMLARLCGICNASAVKNLSQEFEKVHETFQELTLFNITSFLAVMVPLPNSSSSKFHNLK